MQTVQQSKDHKQYKNSDQMEVRDDTQSMQKIKEFQARQRKQMTWSPTLKNRFSSKKNILADAIHNRKDHRPCKAKTFQSKTH